MNNTMSMHPLVSEQVIVITGASSGNGLATARRFGKVGAKVVLATRNEAALNVDVNKPAQLVTVEWEAPASWDAIKSALTEIEYPPVETE